MKQAKLLVLFLAAGLALPPGATHACFDDSVTEISFEGNPSGSDPFKLTTPEKTGVSSLTWVDDDGLPTILTILQVAESGKDVTSYGDLFKKSLTRLAAKVEEYGKNSDDAEAKAHYKSIAEGAKKFLEKFKDKPFDQKAAAAFYEGMTDPIYGAIIDGVFEYELLDPKTGKHDDPDNPSSPIGYFDPAAKFRDKADGASDRGCGSYSLKVKSAQKAGVSGGGDTYMVNPGR